MTFRKNLNYLVLRTDVTKIVIISTYDFIHEIVIDKEIHEVIKNVDGYVIAKK